MAQPEHPPQHSRVLDACPHCGQKLSPWQQVLLNVDHALMCRNCWYRIILDVFEEEPRKGTKPGKPPSTKK